MNIRARDIEAVGHFIVISALKSESVMCVLAVCLATLTAQGANTKTRPLVLAATKAVF